MSLNYSALELARWNLKQHARAIVMGLVNDELSEYFVAYDPVQREQMNDAEVQIVEELEDVIGFAVNLVWHYWMVNAQNAIIENGNIKIPDYVREKLRTCIAMNRPEIDSVVDEWLKRNPY